MKKKAIKAALAVGTIAGVWMGWYGSDNLHPIYFLGIILIVACGIPLAKLEGVWQGW